MATNVTVNMCSRLLRSFSGLNPSRLQPCLLQRKQWRGMTTATENAKENPDGETKPTDASAHEAKIAELEKSFADEKELIQKELTEFKDKYKRSLAEAENVRQRMQKQVGDAKLFGIQGFCKDLLEVADILQAATDAVPADQLEGDNPHLKNLFEGLTMTEQQLQKVFTRNGLNKINPKEGEKFNPHHHEALFQQPAPEGREKDTVAIVTKIGYMLHGRTIRPALVGVFKA